MLGITLTVPLLDEAFDVLLILEPIVVLIQIIHPCVQLSRLLFGSLRFLLLIVDEIRRVVLLIIILFVVVILRFVIDKVEPLALFTTSFVLLLVIFLLLLLIIFLCSIFDESRSFFAFMPSLFLLLVLVLVYFAINPLLFLVLVCHFFFLFFFVAPCRRLFATPVFRREILLFLFVVIVAHHRCLFLREFLPIVTLLVGVAIVRIDFAPILEASKLANGLRELPALAHHGSRQALHAVRGSTCIRGDIRESVSEDQRVSMRPAHRTRVTPPVGLFGGKSKLGGSNPSFKYQSM
mmetsp:Transcript_6096/g.10570  ORF Transcript_6096/g.10570 Transcript_6096/m.10570 type:complete len:293 (-) Transcript_6096:7-885(-)